MKINSLEINNIAGIKKLVLSFNENMNLICGPNGIGKTTILECIGHTFSISSTKILKKNALSETANFIANLTLDGTVVEKTIDIQEFTPVKQSSIQGLHEGATYLIMLKANRIFDYLELNSVNKDIAKPVNIMWEEAKYGVKINEIKNWFVNRYLYSAHADSLSAEQIHNLNLAKECFSIIDEDFKFSRVLASDNEIMLNTPNGEIYYEYLSSGFKSVISIIFGIIKDIEFRFKNPCIKADEFNGIILIDELELHLHPSWQSKIATILTQVFPKAQFIATTHSPHIIQNAKPQEIIALERNNGEAVRRDLQDSEFGFQGWTIEEVLIDVMGMEDTRTDIFHTTLKKYENLIENQDYKEAEIQYALLDKLLHHNNHLRKLLKFDLISIKDKNL